MTNVTYRSKGRGRAVTNHALYAIREVAQTFENKETRRAAKPNVLGSNAICVGVGWDVAASMMARTIWHTSNKKMSGLLEEDGEKRLYRDNKEYCTSQDHIATP